MTVITIRPSNRGDGDEVLRIWAAAVDATHDFLKREDRDAIESELRDFLPGAPLLLAVDAGDRPLGFMLMGDAHMEALFIDPDSRGKGVGRTLVQHALALHGTISIDVNEQNEQAVGFYEYLGFVPTGRSERDGQGRAYPLIHLRSAA